ncbi:MAG: ribosome silencing factor [Planctomycetaceae bacterium]
MSSDEFLSVPGLRSDSAHNAADADDRDPESPPDSPAPLPRLASADADTEFDPSFETETVTAERDPELYSRSLQNALTAARCADEMRARDIVVLDMTKIASIVDFFVIATGTSRRQMHAIADEVNRKLKREGHNERLSVEGYRTEANWILMDFGDVVLHVFTEEGRELYDLENLKANAARINWQES